MEDKKNWKKTLGDLKYRNKKDQQKRTNSIQYYRRTVLTPLIKEVNNYVSNHNPIRFTRIEEINKKHGIHCHFIENTENPRNIYTLPSGSDGEIEWEKNLRDRYGDDGSKLPGLKTSDASDL